ncbi:hypothetical protein HEQ69_04520 [Haematospirillum jordaniae]|uniref:hypothetical protein n=1 Tax=Haematospirillum jordaniae TaxID=1549855 RepID=UPI0012E7DA90|nr:hypothetical protein [Haematospirillum jordaniae]NKD44981.1 hypothetical protein [Haematospirillum jordaniae]NKD67650.1 hypothetical protein [Haematospirillum jordaniae]
MLMLQCGAAVYVGFVHGQDALSLSLLLNPDELHGAACLYRHAAVLAPECYFRGVRIQCSGLYSL